MKKAAMKRKDTNSSINKDGSNNKDNKTSSNIPPKRNNRIIQLILKRKMRKHQAKSAKRTLLRSKEMQLYRTINIE